MTADSQEVAARALRQDGPTMLLFVTAGTIGLAGGGYMIGRGDSGQGMATAILGLLALLYWTCGYIVGAALMAGGGEA